MNIKRFLIMILFYTIASCSGGGGDNSKKPAASPPAKKPGVATSEVRLNHRLAYLSSRDSNGDGSNPSDIYMLKPDGSEVQLTVEDDVSACFSWAPDGTNIVYSSQIYKHIYKVNTAAPYTITPLTSGSEEDDCPSYSHTGDKIAFIRTISGVSQVYKMNADGTGITQVTTVTSRETTSGKNNEKWGVSWAPDDSALTFVTLERTYPENTATSQSSSFHYLNHTYITTSKPDGTNLEYWPTTRPSSDPAYLIGGSGCWNLPCRWQNANYHSTLWSPDGRFLAFTENPRVGGAGGASNPETNSKITINNNSLSIFKNQDPLNLLFSETTNNPFTPDRYLASIQKIAAGDLNSDGITDFVGSSMKGYLGGRTIYTYLSDGLGGYTSQQIYNDPSEFLYNPSGGGGWGSTIPAPSNLLLIEDLGTSATDSTLDGYKDILFSKTAASTIILYGNGTGTFDILLRSQTMGFGLSENITFWNYDGDGKPDIYISYNNGSSQVNGVYRNFNGTNRWVYTPLGYDISSDNFIAGNFDNDGDDDIAAIYPTNIMHIIFNTPTCPCPPGLPAIGPNIIIDSQAPQGTKYRLTSKGDFDNDGKVDLVYASTAFSEGISTIRIVLLYGNGDGTFTISTPLSYSSNPAGNFKVLFSDSIAAADFNKDTYDDIVFTAWNGEALLLKSNGISRDFTRITDTGLNKVVGGQRILAGEFTGDADTDLIVYGAVEPFQTDHSGYYFGFETDIGHSAVNTGYSWSPDSTKLAFTQDYYYYGYWKPDVTKIYTLGLYSALTELLTGVDGTGTVRKITTAHDYQPAWSPDDSVIVFVSDRDANQEIYAINTNGTDVAKNIMNLKDTNEWYPVWSPVP